MRRRAPQGDNPERWLVSYADFVTLLFAFFVVMFATSHTDRAKLTEVSNSLSAGLDPWRSGDKAAGVPAEANTPVAPPVEAGNSDLTLLRRALERSLEEHETIVQEENGRVVVRVQDGILFAAGSAGLRDGAGPLLQELGDALRALPGREVWLEGHTDNSPIHTAEFPSNWELSTARAIAVLEALVEKCGLPESRFAASGYGEFRPLNPNTTEAGRAANRRVDIVILPDAAGERMADASGGGVALALRR